MEIKGNTSFTSVMAVTQTCQQSIPQQYILPLSQRPNTALVDQTSTILPLIDLSMMDHPAHKSQLIHEVHAACNRLGFFQVINHGIPTSVMKDALDSAEQFFDLPSDEKMCFASADVREHDDIKEGSQVMAVNCYPSCPEPDLALGMPPHTDYGTLTILNQSHQGLEIMDHDKKWHHRAILNVQRKRFSIASLHSMQLHTKVGPAPELVDKQHPAA